MTAAAVDVCNELSGLLSLTATIDRISDQQAGDIKRASKLLSDNGARVHLK